MFVFFVEPSSVFAGFGKVMESGLFLLFFRLLFFNTSAEETFMEKEFVDFDW